VVKIAGYSQQIRKMSNKELLKFHNDIRKEKEHKKNIGRYKDSNYVSQNEFWGPRYTKEISNEVQRRKESGKISTSAGKTRKSNNNNLFGGGWF